MSDALLEAIQTRNVDRVAVLLAAGADPNESGKSRYSGRDVPPLHAAIWELDGSSKDDPDGTEPPGPIDSVVLLLRYGARVTGWDIDKDRDPLFDAVLDNQIEAVRLVIAHGANPNVQDDEGTSPLRFCAQQGYLEIARLLLLCGATKTIDDWGGQGAMTALGLAARGLHVEMVKLLLAHGANPLAQDVDGLTPLDCLEFANPRDDPASLERLREIRQLLGEPAPERNGDE